MACASGSKSSLTGSKAKRWLSDLTEELGVNFAEFASHIGFKESQVKVIQETGQHLHQLVMSRWLDTIGRHTTKHQHIVYTALVAVKRQDLLDKHFKGEIPEKYSDDIWEDFLEELHDVDFSNEESIKQGQEKMNDGKKKKKSKSKRTNRKNDDGNGRKENVEVKVEESVKEKMISADDKSVPGNQQLASSAGNEQQSEKIKETDTKMLTSTDNTSLPRNPQIVSSAVRQQQYVSIKGQDSSVIIGDHATMIYSRQEHEGNGRKENVDVKGEESVKEKMISADDKYVPGNQQLASSAENEQQSEKIKETDTKMLTSTDNTSLPRNPQIVSSAECKQKEKIEEKVKQRERENVTSAENTSSTGNLQIDPSAGDPEEHAVGTISNVDSDDDVTNIENVGMPTLIERQQQHVFEINASSVIIGDNAVMINKRQEPEGNGRKENVEVKVEESGKEKIISADDKSVPGNQQLASSAGNEQQSEKIKETDTKMLTSTDNTSLPRNPQIVSSAEKQQQHVVIKSKDSPVIIGDHATVIYDRQEHEDEEKNIKDKLYDIMKSKEAVGKNAKKNKMNLQTLETLFLRRNGKHFETMYRKSLLIYLKKQHFDYFKLSMQSGQWFVHVEEKIANIFPQTHKASEFLKDIRMQSGSKCNENTKTFTRPTYDSTKAKTYIQNICTLFDDFLDHVEHFRDGNYLLMISKTDFTKHEEALWHIPWLCIFDFDADSFTEGLYFRNDDFFRANRAVYPCTWQDCPCIQAFGTEWCFISGSTHSPGSSTPEGLKMWYNHIQGDFSKHITAIKKFLDTVKKLTVVALWPRDQNTGKQFHKIISVLNESIKPFPKVVVVDDNPTPETKALIDLVEPDYTLKEKLEHIFHDLAANVGQKHKPKQSTYSLPTASGATTSIDSTKAASFRESMQVLYLDNPIQNNPADLFAYEEQEKLFFRGGNLTWEAYYNNGPEHFYVPREIMPLIVNDIRSEFIDKMESGEITIFHAPGAGGTTLCQNILWELRAITPCVEVRSDTLVTPKQAASHITELYKATRLPVVVLFDELNDTSFEIIQGKLKDIRVIFLKLKRVSIIGKKLKKNEYFLPGALSANEAKRMGPKFTRCCGDDSHTKDQIQKLVDDIVAGHKHHLIEFGLVTYLHEYTGVAAYVSEYLKLGEQNKELDGIRNVLGYMSLVQFFGQGVIPCQLFGTMLGKSPDFTFKYVNFPPTIKEFTVPVESDFNPNSVRICHYLIAKEILDQILSKAPTKDKSQDLSKLAKQNLQPFVLKFIEDLKIRQEKLGDMSKTVFDIILQLFIYREDRSTYNQQREIRTKFSRLIETIPSEQPFTERLQVMETLAESFPGSPSLWAHFGRALAILRPTEREKTESCFKKAITGCEDGKNLTFMDNDESDTQLSYVFHMYGIFYLKQIRADIEHCNSPSEMQFQDTVNKIISLGTTACESFDKSRKLRYAGFQESLGCFGMIDVRLAICEFIKRHYKFVTIQELLDMSKNSEITSFVEKSLSLIQQLFVQCNNVVDSAQIGDDFYKKITLYNSLFKGMVPNMYIDIINVPESVETRGVAVAAIKLKYGEDNRLGTVDDITDDADIKRVISLLEQNFDDFKQMNMIHSKTGIDHDFLDWIHAIRLANQLKLYTVEDVLGKVRFWFQTVRSPYSRVYLFILLFAYACHPPGPCKESILKEAMDLKENEDWNPAVKTLANPKIPREWFSREPGIRCLLRGKSVVSQKKCIDDEETQYNLLALKGTIRPPNTYRIDGYINMDVEGNRHVKVLVHFCPIDTKGKLVGQAYVGRRVEFRLAFTPQVGLEAYDVTELKKSTCKNCKSKVEIVSIERSKICNNCGKEVENEYPMIFKNEWQL